MGADESSIQQQLRAMSALQLSLTSAMAALAANQAWLVEQIQSLLPDQKGAICRLSLIEQLHASVVTLHTQIATLQTELNAQDQDPP